MAISKGSTGWQRYIQAAASLGEVTRKQAEQAVRTLVKQGEVAQDRMEKSVDDLLKKSEQNRKAIAGIVRSEMDKAVSRLGLASQKDLDRLAAKIDRLERTAKTAAAAGPAKRAPAKKSSAAKRAAGKSTTKKATAKKGTAKKGTAKKASGSAGGQSS